jgi:hypothetical protein
MRASGPSARAPRAVAGAWLGRRRVGEGGLARPGGVVRFPVWQLSGGTGAIKIIEDHMGVAYVKNARLAAFMPVPGPWVVRPSGCIVVTGAGAAVATAAAPGTPFRVRFGLRSQTQRHAGLAEPVLRTRAERASANAPTRAWQPPPLDRPHTGPRCRCTISRSLPTTASTRPTMNHHGQVAHTTPVLVRLAHSPEPATS